MRSMLFLAFALAAALPAAAADRPSVGIAFLNDGGLHGVMPHDNSLSLLRGNGCVGTTSAACPTVKAMSWSPDGTRLAFTLGSALYVHDSRDGTQRRLPTEVDVDGGSRPAWSPDGQELAFASVHTEDIVEGVQAAGSTSSKTASSPSDLYRIHVDSGALRKLTTGRQTKDPAWEPGSQIVYSGLVQGRWELFVVDPDGSERQLTDGAAAMNRRPFWSPDGTEIAFLRDAGSLQARLNTIRPDGSGLRVLSSLPVDTEREDELAWSPDGSMIAISTSVNGRVDPLTGEVPGRDLYVIAADGSGERRLTQSAERGAADRGPTWSPDGDQLAFESYDRDERAESALYTVNADGKCERRVAAVGGWRPLWQPLRGSALAPRECSDLAIVATGLTKRGSAGRVRVRLLNDGTTPLLGIRFRDASSGATVVSAQSRNARCSVRQGRLACRLSRLRVGAVVDVEVVVEARVLRGVGRFVIGPEIEFLASVAGAETSASNNRHVGEVSMTSCTTGTRGAGSVKGTDDPNTICGRRGRDRILGEHGGDWIRAGAGNDVVNGGPDNDVIVAGPGRDLVSCGAGHDRVTVDGADQVARDCERVRRIQGA
jgi:Tol biopolymer transport system component